jgi:hypothetical protein
MEINSTNFNQYFFDVMNYQPAKGDCMARFRAVAELVDGFEKREMIELLKKEDSAHAVAQMMRKLAHAAEPDIFRVPKLMAQDLLEGMSEDKVAEKPYEYVIELFYYTKPEYVPVDDPNWSIINIVNIGDYISTEIKNCSEDPI